MSNTLSLSVQSSSNDFKLDASFEIGSGVTALFGPSGAGKTMLLDFIAGLRKPDSGHISLQGEMLLNTVTKISLPPEKRDIGYVFQHGRLFPHLTVEQNLRYGERRQMVGTIQMPFDQVVSVLGIETLLARRPYGLSGGEQQRVAIGRAIMSNPKLILMDEPLASLDPPRRQEILPFIEKLRDNFAIPIIYVSHNLDEVIRLADLVVLIEEGLIIARGPVEDILNRQDLHRFLGYSDQSGDYTSPSTILTARISEHDIPFQLTKTHGQGLSLWLPRLNLPIGETVRLRLRASDISIALQEPRNTSIINAFEANISVLGEPLKGFITVALRLDSGLQVWSRITNLSATRLKLHEGKRVWGAIKSVAVITGTTPN